MWRWADSVRSGLIVCRGNIRGRISDVRGMSVGSIDECEDADSHRLSEHHTVQLLGFFLDL